MSLYLDTVQMQYTKDPQPQTYYQLSGDFESAEFILPDSQDNLPSSPNAILALALRQSQYASDIEDLENNNFDYDAFKELINMASDNIIVNGAVVLQKNVQSIQELNNKFQTIDMTINSDGLVDVNKYKSIQDNVFHVLFTEDENIFDYTREQITEIEEIATALLSNNEADITLEAIDEAKNQLGLLENITPKEYDVEITRTYIKTATVTVTANNEKEARDNAFEIIDDALASTSLTLIDDDEVNIEPLSITSNSPSNK